MITLRARSPAFPPAKIAILAVAAVFHWIASASLLAGPPRPAPVEAAGAMPSSLDGVLVIDNAAAMRKSAAFQALRDTINDAAPLQGASGDPEKAWSSLADRLGWNRDDAFDRLLGTRVIFVWRARPPAPPAVFPVSGVQWAIVSEVSESCDRRIREKLRVAPRGVVEGHQILSVENGPYELTTHRFPASDDREPGRVALILGPSGDSDLFDEMVRVATAAAVQPIAQTRAFAAALGLPGDVLLMVRLPQNDGPPDPQWGDYLVTAARRAADGWTADLRIRVASATPELRRIPATSATGFKSLKSDCLIAIVETRAPAAETGEPNPIFSVLTGIGIPDDLQALLGSHQALVVRSAPCPPGIAVSLSVDTTDVVRMIKRADEVMARTISSVETQFGRAQQPAPDFHALAPCAIRSMAIDLPAVSPLMGTAFPIVAWGTVSTSEASQADAKAVPGWWTVAVAPAERSTDQAAPTAVACVTDALARGQHDGPAMPWISLGIVRPGEIAESTGPTIPNLGSWREICRRFQSCEWAFWATPEGTIAGTLELKVSP
ncbi:MAG: hypothetical protein KF745_13490 [Phycisphaeraceae bacterium]|nr:hypothetical protein [Phycisphaeraceae bacterium]